MADERDNRNERGPAGRLWAKRNFEQEAAGELALRYGNLEELGGFAADSEQDFLFQIGEGQNSRRWAALLLSGRRESILRRLPLKLKRHSALLDSLQIEGVLVLSEYAILRPNFKPYQTGPEPFKLRFATVAELRAGTIDLGEPQPESPEEDFERRVFGALQARYWDFEPRPFGGRSAPDALFSSGPDGLDEGASRWAAMLLADGGGSMGQAEFDNWLGDYAKVFERGAAGGLLVVTLDGLEVRLGWPGREMQPCPIRSCTLDNLLSKDFVLDPTTKADEADAGRARATARAGDYPGRIVRLDRTTRAYQEAMQALNDLAYELRASNQPGLPPEDKARLVAELESAQKLLAADTVRVEAARSVIPGPLKWLAKQAAQVAIKELAFKAWELLKEAFSGGPPDLWT